MPEALRYKELEFKIESTETITKQDGAGGEIPIFRFRGYASTWQIDLENERFEYGAFAKSIAKRLPALFWSHLTREPSIGIVTEAQENKKGLFIVGEMPLTDTFVSGRIVPQMQVGAIKTMSIGFRATVVEWSRDDKVPTIFKEAELREVSLVNFPANPGARVTALKEEYQEDIETKAVTAWGSLPKTLADRNRRWDSRAAENRWRAFSGSMEKPSARYKRNYLYSDSEKPELFTSYKLGIGDVVDGKHVAVPRAIFAVRVVVAGGRGGLNVPEADLMGIKRIVSKYYELMGLDDPYKTQTWSEVEVKNLARADLDFVLRTGQLSRKASDYIASMVAVTNDPGRNSHHADVGSKDNDVINMLLSRLNKEG